MDFFIIPRRMARLQYMTARLPFTILDKYVVARYWDERALPRRGFELFLGSMDEIARCLLANNHIARRDDAVIGRPESAAKASELEAKGQARWAQYEENLQAAARRAREQAHEGIKAAADTRRLVKYRPEEADRPGQPGDCDQGSSERAGHAETD